MAFVAHSLALNPVLKYIYIADLRQECHNSKFGIFELLVQKETLGDAILKGSVITQFARLATGELLCRRRARRKL